MLLFFPKGGAISSEYSRIVDQRSRINPMESVSGLFYLIFQMFGLRIAWWPGAHINLLSVISSEVHSLLFFIAIIHSGNR